MDLQFFIALNIMSLSGLVILMALATRAHGALSWVAVNLVVLAAGFISLYFWPEWSGAITAGAFVPLVLMPAMLAQMAQRRALQGRNKDAAELARWGHRFHPTPRGRFQSELWAALAHAELPDRLRALAELGRRVPGQRALVAVLALAEEDRWAAVLDHRAGPDGALADLRTLQIRALGETGRLEEMIRLFQVSRPALGMLELAMVQLFVLAFTGNRPAVERLLDHRMRALDRDSRSYWLAVAAFNAPGLEAQGRRELEALAAHSPRSKTRLAAARHLARGQRPQGLSQDAAAVLAETSARVLQAAHLGGARSMTQLPATLALIVLNSAMFGVELAFGGSEDLEVLVDLGALWPPLVIEAGEWWRLATATLLHYGPLHLIANMFILMVLGRSVERAYGWPRFLAIYAVGGVASSACVLAMMHAGLIAEGVLVGASGAIFAVLGAEAARLASVWRRSRDTVDRRQLEQLGLVLLVQVVIDLSVPEISATAHFSGFASGLLVGLLFAQALPAAPEARDAGNA